MSLNTIFTIVEHGVDAGDSLQVTCLRLHHSDGVRLMARNKSKGKGAAFTMFNVNYKDGMVTSNRRVSSALLDQSFGESFQDLARIAIKHQDNEIAQRSGQRRAAIKDIVRA